MQPLIIALGRSDNHALLAREARALGVEYRGFEAHDAADLLRDLPRLRAQCETMVEFRPVILAAIDSSVSASTLRSLAHHLQVDGSLTLSLRTDPELLDRSPSISEEIKDHDFLYALSIARSPHGQISIWPIIRIERDGSALPIIDPSNRLDAGAGSDAPLEEVALRIIDEASKDELVGMMTYIIDPNEFRIVRREFGAAPITFWSESACYTSASEQLIRAILDLPLGDARLIDFEEFYMKEEMEIEAGVIADPIRPFLHLFARNPRLKVTYQTSDDWSRCTISLFASSADEGLIEMAHARDFIAGIDE